MHLYSAFSNILRKPNSTTLHTIPKCGCNVWGAFVYIISRTVFSFCSPVSEVSYLITAFHQCFENCLKHMHKCYYHCDFYHEYFVHHHFHQRNEEAIRDLNTNSRNCFLSASYDHILLPPLLSVSPPFPRLLLITTHPTTSPITVTRSNMTYRVGAGKTDRDRDRD